MELLPMISYGTPVLLLGLIVLYARMSSQMDDIREDVRDMKRNKPWSDTCLKTQEGFDRRILRIETFLNGNLK